MASRSSTSSNWKLIISFRHWWTECCKNTVTQIKMSEKVWPLAQLFVADADPELVEILRLEPAGLDTEEVDLFLESNSNLLSLFHSSSLSFSFFFSLFKWKKNKTKQKFRTSLIVKVGWVTIFSEFIHWIYHILYFIFYISNVFFLTKLKKKFTR